MTLLKIWKNKKMKFRLNKLISHVATKESDIMPEISNYDDLQINKGRSIRFQKDHPQENIIGNMNEIVVIRSRESISNSCFISKIEFKNVK